MVTGRNLRRVRLLPGRRGSQEPEPTVEYICNDENHVASSFSYCVIIVDLLE